MSEPVTVLAAIAAGLSAGLAVLGAGAGGARRPSVPWLDGVPPARPLAHRDRLARLAHPALLRACFQLQSELDRAGIREPAVGVAGLLLAATASCAGLAAAAALVFDPAGVWWTAIAAAGGALSLAAAGLRTAIRNRREGLISQLGPLLELLSLELSSGAAPGPALEAVLRRLDGELAAELQLAVSAARVPGTSSLDQRLAELGDRLRIPALVSLGGVIATSREYGSSLSPGVRALAAELRRARRRQVIAASRRALNRVLVPSAIGVLAPFMAILLFPALTTLTRSLR